MSPVTAASAAPVCAGAAADEQAAMDLAKACDREVDVLAATTELTRKTALPTGEMRYESAVEPQRAKGTDGKWRDIDLSMRRGGDGRWRAAVATTDVSFSAGGSGPFAVVVDGGRTLTMSWPGKLPTPVVAGDQITYPAVLPDVDLVGRVTQTGFTHVLVVKTPQAAANPAVRSIHFDLGGDARVETGKDQVTRAYAGSELMLSGNPPLMWNSAKPATPAQRTAGGAGPSAMASTVESASDTATVAPVGVAVADGDLVLTPDPAMLTAPASSYPLFIDPEWSKGRGAWAYASNNNKTNDTSYARVGHDPADGRLYRSYYSFDTRAIAGAEIREAHVYTKLYHSYSCGDTTVTLWHTSGFTSPRTNWAPKMNKVLDWAAGHADKDGGCGPAQPDMDINFIGSAVTTLIASVAKGKIAGVSVGLCACDSNGSNESDQQRWKKFYTGATKLIAEYNWKPGTPSGLQTAGLVCGTGKLSIGSTSPKLSAVFPDKDTSQAISAAWEWLEVPANGVFNDATPRKTPVPPAVSVPANGRATSAALTGVIPGHVYAWRAHGTDPAPYNSTSLWSPWCLFEVDNGVPAPPTVAPLTTALAPGDEASFRFTSPEPDVVSFTYGWDDTGNATVPATGTTSKTADVTVVPPRYGTNTLFVYATDATGNKGNHQTYEFEVSPPSPPVAAWSLETTPALSESFALSDSQGQGGLTPLTPTGLAWFQDARLMNAKSADFNGTSTVLTTAGSVVDQNKAFGVTAWVRVNDESMSCSGNQTAVSADGTFVSGFFLSFDCVEQKWHFKVVDKDSATPWFMDVAANIPAVTDQWMHLAGTSDPVSRSVRLYVNGVLAQDLPVPDGWVTSHRQNPIPAEKIVIGRDRWNSVDGGRFPGQLADVRIFDRAIVDQDLTGQLASEPGSGGIDEAGVVEPVEVARFGFDGGVACYDPAITPETCAYADATGNWNRQVQLTGGEDVVETGPSGNALVLDDTHWMPDETDPHYGIVTHEYGRTQRNITPTVATPTWDDQPVLRTDVSFTVSAWVRLDNTDLPQTFVAQDSTAGTYSGFTLGYVPDNGGQWQFKVRRAKTVDGDSSIAVAPAALADDDPTDWHHLVAVLDQPTREVRLYVDGNRVDTEPVNTRYQPWHAAGALLIGRGSTPAGPVNWFHGAIDEVRVFQGAVTDGGVVGLDDDLLG